MSFRTILAVSVAAVVLGSILAMEWVYWQMAHYLVIEMPTAPVDRFWIGSLVRFTHALLLLAALLLTLWLTTHRYVERPLRALSGHIRKMGTGNWAAPVPAEAKGAPENLDVAVALLGSQLDAVFPQMEMAARRSALALLLSRSDRQLAEITESVDGVCLVAESSRFHQQVLPAQAVDNLRQVRRSIEILRQTLDGGFDTSSFSTVATPTPVEMEGSRSRIRPPSGRRIA